MNFIYNGNVLLTSNESTNIENILENPVEISSITVNLLHYIAANKGSKHLGLIEIDTYGNILYGTVTYHSSNTYLSGYSSVSFPYALNLILLSNGEFNGIGLNGVNYAFLSTVYINDNGIHLNTNNAHSENKLSSFDSTKIYIGYIK